MEGGTAKQQEGLRKKCDALNKLNERRGSFAGAAGGAVLQKAYMSKVSNTLLYFFYFYYFINNNIYGAA